MDTNMDAMSSTLLHMRQQLNDSHRQITILNEENTRLKTLCQSTNNPLNTPNGTTHTASTTKRERQIIILPNKENYQ
ncbi:unnamed protein product [Adineta steineri]|uniref:Uncharacterized protein n=1 Tax=Adineta steineri TaxID=433720 RepID=A0A814ZM07_9BILA|nr:unnamed protein product [Adineta steineri]